MRQIFFYLIVSLTVLSCNNVSYKQAGANQDVQQVAVTSATPVSPVKGSDNNWLNDLMLDYMQHSNQELIQLSLKDSSIEEVWIDQGMAERNGSIYYMCQIGHRIAEENGSDPRFATDGWAYVDSAKRILYEYDLPNDSLILWKQ